MCLKKKENAKIVLFDANSHVFRSRPFPAICLVLDAHVERSAFPIPFLPCPRDGVTFQAFPTRLDSQVKTRRPWPRWPPSPRARCRRRPPRRRTRGAARPWTVRRLRAKRASRGRCVGPRLKGVGGPTSVVWAQPCAMHPYASGADKADHVRLHILVKAKRRFAVTQLSLLTQLHAISSQEEGGGYCCPSNPVGLSPPPAHPHCFHTRLSQTAGRL